MNGLGAGVASETYRLALHLGTVVEPILSLNTELEVAIIATLRH